MWGPATGLIFQYGSCPPSWTCDARVWTTHKGHLVVFITVQNLVRIDTAVSIICKFFILCDLGMKTHIHALKIGGLSGDITHKIGSSLTMTTKRHFLAGKHVI